MNKLETAFVFWLVGTAFAAFAIGAEAGYQLAKSEYHQGVRP